MGTKMSLPFGGSWVSCAMSEAAEQATLAATRTNHTRESRERARIRPSCVERTPRRVITGPRTRNAKIGERSRQWRMAASSGWLRHHALADHFRCHVHLAKRLEI